MKLSDFMFGKSPSMKQMPTMSTEQQGLFSQLVQMLSGQGGVGQAQNLLQDWMDPSQESYDRFAAPYMQQFEQETLPGIGERYAGAGANSGALQSSGFGQALGAAGANLQTNLAGMKSNLQQTALQHILNQLNNAVSQPTFAYAQKPGSQGFAQGLMQNAGGIGSIMANMPSFGFGGGGSGAGISGARPGMNRQYY